MNLPLFVSDQGDGYETGQINAVSQAREKDLVSEQVRQPMVREDVGHASQSACMFLHV